MDFSGGTALHYNVIRGKISEIREEENGIHVGNIVCVEANSSDLSTVGFEESELPPLGQVFFYLVEYNDGRNNSYGTESLSKPRVIDAGGCP